jgi:hypothetical protein
MRILLVFLLTLFALSMWSQPSGVRSEVSLYSATGGVSSLVWASGRQLETVMAASERNSREETHFLNEKMKDLYRDLESKKVRRKSSGEVVEIIAETLRGRFFHRYDPLAGFEQLFHSGTYNDLTASMLYGLVLQHFEIPYILRLEPERIFVVVDPRGAAIEMEVRRKDKKATRLDQGFVLEYIELLGQLEIATEVELAHRSPEDLMRQYFMPQTQEVDLRELSGVQFFQRALRAYQAGDYHQALSLVEKAQALHRSPRYDVIRFACLYQLSVHIDCSDLKSLAPLFELYRLHPVETVRTNILRQFAKVTGQLLFEEGKPSELDRFYRFFRQKSTGDESLIRNIQEIYLLQKTKYYAQNDDFDKVVQYADSIHQVISFDSKSEKLLNELLVWSLRRERDFSKGLGRLAIYLERFPFLKNAPEIKDLELFYHAERIKFYFDDHREAEGLTGLREFEALLARIGRTPKADYWIQTAYLAAADFYSRLKEHESARSMIQRGLDLSPNDNYFRHSMDVFDNFMR